MEETGPRLLCGDHTDLELAKRRFLSVQEIIDGYKEVYETHALRYVVKGLSFRDRSKGRKATSFLLSERDRPENSFDADGRVRIQWVEPEEVTRLEKLVLEPPSPL